MATIVELQSALIKADKAGNEADARALTSAIDNFQATPQFIADDTLNAYFEGTLDEASRAKLEDDVRAGKLELPEGVTTQQYARPQDIPTNLTGLKLLRDPSLGEQLVGAGETALTLGTAATGGAIGNIVGTLQGIADKIQSGEFGSQEAAQEIKRRAEELGQEYTYQPRTQTGQEMLQTTAETLAPLEALTPIAGELGAVARGARQAIPKAAPKAKTPPPAPEPTIDAIAKLTVKAAKGKQAAKEELAALTKANPEALASAERLGIELPTDILGDSTLVKQTAGLVRSQIGKESAEFVDTIINATNKADELLDTLGKKDIASASGEILDSLDKQIKTLDRQAGNIYNKIKSELPKNTPITPVNSFNRISQVVEDIGGFKNLTKEEKRLHSLLKQKNVTYEALDRERRMIGQALGKMPSGKYVNADKSLLSRVYASLKQDQLDAVENALGVDARDRLHLADRTFQRKIALEDKVSKTFGRDGEGSIASLLKRAITQGAKGDITALNKVIKTTPKGLRKDAIISAIGDAVKSERATDAGQFDFGKFTKIYTGLRNNPPVYKKIIDELGGESHKLLQDLDVISKRITQGKQDVLTTGKANQEILKGIERSSSLIEGMARFIVEKGVRKASFGAISPSESIMDMFFTPTKKKIESMHKLFSSQDFKDLAFEASTGMPKDNVVKRFANSKPFKTFIKESGKTMQNPEAFILESLILGEEDGE